MAEDLYSPCYRMGQKNPYKSGTILGFLLSLHGRMDQGFHFFFCRSPDLADLEKRYQLRLSHETFFLCLSAGSLHHDLDDSLIHQCFLFATAGVRSLLLLWAIGLPKEELGAFYGGRWCPRWDSNPQSRGNTILSRARIPIPPLGQARKFSLGPSDSSKRN